MIIKDELESEEKISKDGNIVNSKRAIHFVMGFSGWVVLQTIYCSYALYIGRPLLFLASWPINIIAITVIYSRKLNWIAYGAGIAFVLNFIVLVSMGLFGILDEEGIGALFILFPPFFLLYLNWVSWVIHL